MRHVLATITFACCVFMPLFLTMEVKAGSGGADLFKTHCVPCHGQDGKGTDLGKQLAAMAEGVEFPDFTSVEWQEKETDERMTEQIKNGSPGRMFSFKDKMNEEEIKAVIVYVRGFPSRQK